MDFLDVVIPTLKDKIKDRVIPLSSAQFHPVWCARLVRIWGVPRFFYTTVWANAS